MNTQNLSSASTTAQTQCEVRVLLDVPWGAGEHPDGRDRLDLFVPKNAQDAPVLFWIHGGGLFMGEKSVAVNVGLAFARAGFLVASTNHRLSPEVAHPGHIRDVAAAFAWVREQIAEYGGNPERICVGGHSAGGYLAGLLAVDGRWLAEVGCSPRDMRCALPLSGFFHVERLAPERPKSVWGDDPDQWPEASPALHVSAEAPAMRLIYAEDDVAARKQTNIDFAEALVRKGVADVTITEIARRDHRSLASLIGTPGDRTTADMLAWLERQLVD